MVNSRCVIVVRNSLIACSLSSIILTRAFCVRNGAILLLTVHLTPYAPGTFAMYLGASLTCTIHGCVMHHTRVCHAPYTGVSYTVFWLTIGALVHFYS